MEHIRVIVRAQQEHAGSRDIAQSMSLAELVDEVLHLQREELRRQGVALTVEVEDRSCSLYRHKVAQILTNLVLNARDAAIAGERDRAVEVRGVVDEGWVVLTVHDSGPGVPPEILGRIFEHGFTTKDGGHGFGLHSSANNAQQMGGSLGSTNGGQLGGAAFRLQVPYRPGEPCPSS
jgi:C4-dicarboxylate-specific signal transduction histidine kinase